MSTLINNDIFLLFVINSKHMSQEITNETNRKTTSINSTVFEDYVEPLMVEWERSAIYVVSDLVKRGYLAYRTEVTESQ